jgi:hypothetical protein
VHHSLVVYIRDFLQPQIDPRYVASIEERVYLEETSREVTPEVWPSQIHQRPLDPVIAASWSEGPIFIEVVIMDGRKIYINIFDRCRREKVVAVIEVVSSSNKFQGPGRDSYLAKQKEVHASDAHLVDIDLLRVGPHVLAAPEWRVRTRGPYDYLDSVNRAQGRRSLFEVHPIGLRQRLPELAIPLAEGEVVLDPQAVPARTHEAGRYRLRIDYKAPCVPPLRPEDQAWADGLVSETRRSADPRSALSGGFRRPTAHAGPASVFASRGSNMHDL